MEKLAYPDLVEWQQRQFKQLATQHVPVKLVIPTLDVMVELLGQQQRFKKFQTKFPFCCKQLFVESHK